MRESTVLTILITGATGNIGRELCKQLSAQNTPFQAMVRAHNGEPASQIDGAEVIAGDFNDEISIAAALEGVDKAFLLTNSSEVAELQHGPQGRRDQFSPNPIYCILQTLTCVRICRCYFHLHSPIQSR